MYPLGIYLLDPLSFRLRDDVLVALAVCLLEADGICGSHISIEVCRYVIWIDVVYIYNIYIFMFIIYDVV